MWIHIRTAKLWWIKYVIAHKGWKDFESGCFMCIDVCINTQVIYYVICCSRHTFWECTCVNWLLWVLTLDWTNIWNILEYRGWKGYRNSFMPNLCPYFHLVSQKLREKNLLTRLLLWHSKSPSEIGNCYTVQYMDWELEKRVGMSQIDLLLVLIPLPTLKNSEEEEKADHISSIYP